MPEQRIRLRMRDHTPLAEVARALFQTYRQRTLVGLSLMAAQAFFYNAIFFTYALVLTDFYRMPADRVGWYILPFAAGNVLGPDSARPAVRYGRTQDHDRIDLCTVGDFARRHRRSVQPRSVNGPDADDCLDDRVLLRLGGGELRLSHGERDFPDRDSRARDRLLLRHRHRRRRHCRTVSVRHADRYRFAHGRRHRLRSSARP